MRPRTEPGRGRSGERILRVDGKGPGRERRAQRSIHQPEAITVLAVEVLGSHIPHIRGMIPPTQCGDDGQETRMDAGYICLLTLPRMPQNRSYSVLHPTDLSSISLPAFAHGLLLATKAKGRFTVLHVDGDEEMHWNEMPGVRTMLAKWGMINGADDMRGLEALGLGVRKVITKGSSPAKCTIEYLEGHPMDLIVLGTHQNTGWQRWAREEVAEPIARASRTAALFIPSNARGMVDVRTGKAQLQKVLIPVAKVPHPSAAVATVQAIAGSLGAHGLECTLLHVGEEQDRSAYDVPAEHGWKVNKESFQGDVVERIIERAQDLDVDLIAMTTKGHDGFLDMLRGSRTEQVLRRASVALLAVPEG